MVDAVNKQTQGGPFENGTDIRRVTYDFDEDAGAISVIDLLEMNANAILVGYYAVVKTAVTSAGAPTVDVGVKGGDTDLLMDALLKGVLLINTLHQAPLVEGTPNVAAMPVRLASGDILSMEIKVAALTAGKIEFTFVFMKE